MEEAGEIVEETTEHAPGPEIPDTGLPEPDYTPATDLDKSDWQIVSHNGDYYCHHCIGNSW